MSLTFQPVRVGNDSDEEGMLVFNGNQRLVAVLTRLSDQYEGTSRHWYLEAGFGRLERRNQHTFMDLDAAQVWIAQRLARGR